jgi:hypothetical protein
MVQSLIAYAVVAAAAAWTVWSLFLKGALRRRAAARKASCGDGCGCAD